MICTTTLLKRHKPTSSHTSVPLKLHFVTSNKGLSLFFTHTPLLSNKGHFHACLIICIVLPSVLIMLFSKIIDFSIRRNQLIKIRDVKFDRYAVTFVGDIFELFNDRGSISPLIDYL